MKTEIKKGFTSGFVLNEQELRRLSATIKEQLKVAYPDSETIQSFEVRFKNGSIAEPATIDEIFAQENRGSESIVRLRMREVAASNKKCVIEVTFADIGDDESGRSISYYITHDDKDWVFVTNSKLDERLSRIRKFAVSRLMISKSMPSLMTAFMMLTFIGVASFSGSAQATLINAIQNLAKHYSSDTHATLVDFITKLEILRVKSSPDAFPSYLLGWMFAGVAIIFGVAFFGKPMLDFFFPAYNFLWGDYVELYQRRRNISYVVFVLIILGIIVAVIANIVSAPILARL